MATDINKIMGIKTESSSKVDVKSFLLDASIIMVAILVGFVILDRVSKAKQKLEAQNLQDNINTVKYVQNQLNSK